MKLFYFGTSNKGQQQEHNKYLGWLKKKKVFSFFFLIKKQKWESGH